MPKIYIKILYFSLIFAIIGIFCAVQSFAQVSDSVDFVATSTDSVVKVDPVVKVPKFRISKTQNVTIFFGTEEQRLLRIKIIQQQINSLQSQLNELQNGQKISI